jgi:hypothetical protein
MQNAFSRPWATGLLWGKKGNTAMEPPFIFVALPSELYTFHVKMIYTDHEDRVNSGSGETGHLDH